MKKVTVISNVLFRAKIVFAVLSILTFIFVSAVIYTGQWEKVITKPLGEKFLQLSSDLAKSLEEKPTPTRVPVVIINNTKTTPIPTPTPKPTVYVPTRVCYRATVTHLDGSTSNLCYNQSDSQQLINLGYDLSSAKTFYQFHLDAAQKYQDMYDQTKSSIYLDAKASSEKSAQREKDKIGSITLQMQTIEKRGY